MPASRPSSQVPADDTPERPRLTDGEKKANHIASGELTPTHTPTQQHRGREEQQHPFVLDADWAGTEQKRRQAIREGFDRLSCLVPGLHGQARSEGVVLHGTVDYIKTLLVERRSMIESLESKGVAVDPEMKK